MFLLFIHSLVLFIPSKLSEGEFILDYFFKKESVQEYSLNPT